MICIGACSRPNIHMYYLPYNVGAHKICMERQLHVPDHTFHFIIRVYYIWVYVHMYVE